MEKRFVDKIRESVGHADIGTAEDGAIVEMKNYNGRLIILKENAIYEMVFRFHRSRQNQPKSFTDHS